MEIDRIQRYCLYCLEYSNQRLFAGALSSRKCSSFVECTITIWVLTTVIFFNIFISYICLNPSNIQFEESMLAVRDKVRDRVVMDESLID